LERLFFERAAFCLVTASKHGEVSISVYRIDPGI